jgi:branched-chain amino acid transport system substrate-binding protein
VPYRGVKFDATGQNVLVRAILMQVQKGKYCTFYPFELASCPVLFPTPTRAQKAKM